MDIVVAVLVVVGVFVSLAISSLVSVASVVGVVWVINRAVVLLRHSFWWGVGKVKSGREGQVLPFALNTQNKT